MQLLIKSITLMIEGYDSISAVVSRGRAKSLESRQQQKRIRSLSKVHEIILLLALHFRDPTQEMLVSQFCCSLP